MIMIGVLIALAVVAVRLLAYEFSDRRAALLRWRRCGGGRR